MRKLLVLSLVAAFAAHALADDVELVTGEVLKGRVVERSAGGISLDHPVLGRQWISAEYVRSIDGAPLNAPAATAPADAGAAAAPAPAATPAPVENPWKWTLELGASGKSGNSDTTDLHAAIAGVQEDTTKRWKTSASWDYSEAEKEKTKNQVDVQGTRDWLVTDSKWFYFATARYQWDEFQEWDGRLSAGVGGGRSFIEREDLKVRGRVGITALKETGSSINGWRPELLIGAESNWKISAAQSLDAAVTGYPDLDDTGEFRLEATLAWSIRLNDADSLRLKIGLKDEYDSHREDPFDDNDFSYFVALLYEF